MRFSNRHALHASSLVLSSAVVFAAACQAGVSPLGSGADDASASDGEGAAGVGGETGTGASGQGGGGVGGAGGSGAEAPELGAPLKIQQTSPTKLVDTAATPGVCGAAAPVEGANRTLTIDLDDCVIEAPGAAAAVGIFGSISIRAASNPELDVLVGPAGGSPGAPHVVGPLVTTTHGFVTMLGADRAFVVEVPGTGPADVVVELTALLVPASEPAAYVHLLDQPVRWYASNPNDDGYRDPWYTMGTVHRYPVVGVEEGATGMFGAVHLGPGVWRDNPVSFHMGPPDASSPLTRWSTAPADAHFPWRYTSFFAVAAGNDEVEMRASSDFEPAHESGIEPWVDAVGWLSAEPAGGLVYRQLDVALRAEVVTENEETVRFTTGIPEAKGVVGTLVFDLPPYNPPQGYRWYHVMVGATEDTFPGALGGGLEGRDWMTASLNQNGKVTTRFVSRTDPEGAFVMRHHAYVSGGATGGAFEVPAEVRVEAVLTDP